jgi:CRP-like cAMP-binding protein
VTAAELREIPLFAGLSDAGAERLAGCAAEVEARPGQTLAVAGDPGSGMYVVLDGAVTVELGERAIELGPGEPVGELALLVPDSGRVGRVRAASAGRCLAVPREEFLALVESEPALAAGLLRIVARRLVAAMTA